MNDNSEEYKNLIQLMRTAPKLNAPQDLTERVIKALPELSLQSGRMATFWHRLIYRSAYTRDGQQSTASESSICFLLTGSFYLVLGAVLMAGLKFMGENLTNTPWIRLLPWFSFFAAFWFFGLAAIMIIGSQRAVAGVKAGTMIFIIAVLAGIPLFVNIARSPFMYLSVEMLLVAASMGLLLYYQVTVFAKEKNGKNENNRKIIV